MILEQLIHRFRLIQSLLEFRPATLEHFAHREIEHLLNEIVHPRSERKHPSFPSL